MAGRCASLDEHHRRAAAVNCGRREISGAIAPRFGDPTACCNGLECRVPTDRRAEATQAEARTRSSSRDRRTSPLPSPRGCCRFRLSGLGHGKEMRIPGRRGDTPIAVDLASLPTG